MDWKIFRHGSVNSTQDVLKGIVESSDKPEEGFVVQAIEQLKGRGRHGRTWHSPPGNLYCSIYLQVPKKLDNALQISYVVSVSLYKALQSKLSGQKAKLKWPNDILVDDKKAAGILIEADIRDANAGIIDFYIGTGINIKSVPEGCFGFENADIEAVRTEFLEQLAYDYEHWKRDGFEKTRQFWNKNAYKMNEILTIKNGQNETRGIFRGVDAKGSAMIEQDDKSIKTVQSGEVLL